MPLVHYPRESQNPIRFRRHIRSISLVKFSDETVEGGTASSLVVLSTAAA